MVATVNNIQTEKAPFSYAHVALITGDQGGGKSVTGTARIVDTYHRDCVRVYCQEVLKIDCEARAYDPINRNAKIKYKGELRLIKIPKEYKLHSSVKIYANYHLYGIPFFYCPSFRQIMEWLKDGTIKDGYLVIDEYYIGGNARESMSALGRELEKQSFQFRKMQLEVIVICPLDRLADWTMRTIVTERISCSYNKDTRIVTLKIKKKGQVGTKEVSYDSTPYRRYYWTNERINA